MVVEIALSELRYLCPGAPVDVTLKTLPHWEQEGVCYFLTFCLADAFTGAAGRFRRNKSARPDDLLAGLEDDVLDRAYGECLLANPNCAKAVMDTLWAQDLRSYLLLAWSIMPNHVHVLLQAFSGFRLNQTLTTWKRVSARCINRVCRNRGKLWQRDCHNRIVRDSAELTNVARYIDNNPTKAGLEKRFTGTRIRIE